jgi:SM-20-related protein
MEQYVSRRYTIGERQIVVLDGVFEAGDVKSLHSFLERALYRCNESDTPETPHNRNWVTYLPEELNAKMPVLSRCVQLAREFGKSEPLKVDRTYVNLNRFGDMQYSHHDGASGVTALYYANSEWHDHWGGETVFYDEKREPVYLVAPRPGRLALFHSPIVHRGGVPSRDCWEARLTVAFKLEPAK